MPKGYPVCKFTPEQLAQLQARITESQMTIKEFAAETRLARSSAYQAAARLGLTFHKRTTKGVKHA